MKRELPSQSELLQLLRYEPKTGKLFWRPRPIDFFNNKRACSTWNARYSGREALSTPDGRGYLFGAIHHRGAKAHRVIWKLKTGEDPEVIDHINGDQSDNRWVNLRSVSHSDNSKNARMNSRNKSGVNGVYWEARSERWIMQMSLGGRKRKHIGAFTDLSLATDARRQAERDLGYTERHGRAR